MKQKGYQEKTAQAPGLRVLEANDHDINLMSARRGLEISIRRAIQDGTYTSNASDVLELIKKGRRSGNLVFGLETSKQTDLEEMYYDKRAYRRELAEQGYADVCNLSELKASKIHPEITAQNPHLSELSDFITDLENTAMYHPETQKNVLKDIAYYRDHNKFNNEATALALQYVTRMISDPHGLQEAGLIPHLVRAIDWLATMMPQYHGELRSALNYNQYVASIIAFAESLLNYLEQQPENVPVWHEIDVQRKKSSVRDKVEDLWHRLNEQRSAHLHSGQAQPSLVELANRLARIYDQLV